MNASIPESKPGSRLSLAELRSRWQRMIADPLLRDLPGKLELNQKGAIEVSPASPRHGRLQALVASELRRLLPDGETIIECPVETKLGIRVPDLVSPRRPRPISTPGPSKCGSSAKRGPWS